MQGSVGWLDTELGALARYETDLTPTLGGSIQVDGSYSDSVFKDAINDPVIAADSYVLVNARLALFDAARSWEVAVWGKNLGDEQYVAQGLNTGLGAGNRNYNAPRTYGASFTYRW